MIAEESIKLLNAYGNSVPGFWGCKSVSHNYLFANINWKHEVGLKSNFNVEGLLDSELPSVISECAEKFTEQDSLVADSKKHLKILNIHPFQKGDCRIYITSKFPFIYDGEIIGIVFSAERIFDKYFFDLATLLDTKHQSLQQNSFSFNNMELQTLLTNREQECLFFIIRGKTAKRIAQLLNLSQRTVEQYINMLKYKLNCHSKIELIEMSLHKGYLNFIPESLFNKQLTCKLET